MTLAHPLVVDPDGWLRRDEAHRQPCALGRAGVVPAAVKREGDGGTPAGVWPLRRLFYRADRLIAAPSVGVSGLSVTPLTPALGWCDDPTHHDYNHLVTLPHPAGYERLWRDDGLYDVIVVLGHNDDPPDPGRGSAIFLHAALPDPGARHGLRPTAGCVAVPLADLLEVLAALPANPVLDIRTPG
ncbi:L,D-transpeptidase family protein [Roseospira visakhapatnamensis]|uniref:L,D-peptidoglycan transpeptidase YkuD (ErfK/YbiS/YcfS/YnhG family) n=1 Tax=Roseospira visakhapatnamensis TaxID=390880 RepID=A0A7W6RGA8_9PROT|nr:L,D-peptidoglycan transpeptidase YkuD (ErfK/YbiS/YcfS/YnhG family) [Roseospira visakhapatnamensis]